MMFCFCVNIVLASSIFTAAKTENHLSPIVTTKLGQLQGQLVRLDNNRDVYQFTSIPVAEPPIGSKRYRKPEPITTWNDTILDATKPTPRCTQLGSGTSAFLGMIRGQEDCLYLNLWVPKDHLDSVVNNGTKLEPLSVYVFIHGGTFIGGSASSQNGSVLAGYNNIIVAHVQYRLGSLGWAYLPGAGEEMPGNMGLWDQLEGLKWVHDNIESFGGNNKAITLGGQSAGAVAVTCHLLSNYSRPYFHRAIIQSGSVNAPWASHTLQQAANVTDFMFEQVLYRVCKDSNLTLNSPTEDKLTCLRSAEAALFPRIADLAPMLKGFGVAFTPIVDGDFLPNNPIEMLRNGDFAKVPILIGGVQSEGSDFLVKIPGIQQWLPTPSNSKAKLANLTYSDYKTLLDLIFKVFMSGVQPLHPVLTKAVELNYWPSRMPSNFPEGEAVAIALKQIMGDFGFTCPIYAWAAATANFSNVYAYHFDHVAGHNSLPEWMGVTHSDDVPYVFGDVFNDEKMAEARMKITDEDSLFSYVMLNYWANFIKTGDPNQGGDQRDVAKTMGIELRQWPRIRNDVVSSPCQTRYQNLNFVKQVLGAGSDGFICNDKARDCQFWQELYPQLVSLLPSSLK